jgi:hypothetical protein
VDGNLPSGPRLARWSASDAAPGVYLVTLRAAGSVLAQRFVLLR